MSWDRTNQRIQAFYLKEHVVTGTVLSTRVKYGGAVQHTLQLDAPITLFGMPRDILLVDEPEVLGKLTVA